MRNVEMTNLNKVLKLQVAKEIIKYLELNEINIKDLYDGYTIKGILTNDKELNDFIDDVSISYNLTIIDDESIKYHNNEYDVNFTTIEEVIEFSKTNDYDNQFIATIKNNGITYVLSYIV